SQTLTSTTATDMINAVSHGQMLRPKDRIPRGSSVPAIHESISACDIACMAAIASGDTKAFLDGLRRTGNTVCGRHPIGLIMAAMEELERISTPDKSGEMNAQENQSTNAEEQLEKGKFNFTRYERSSDVVSVSDSSVSYVSAFAVL